MKIEHFFSKAAASAEKALASKQAAAEGRGTSKQGSQQPTGNDVKDTTPKCDRDVDKVGCLGTSSRHNMHKRLQYADHHNQLESDMRADSPMQADALMPVA